MLMCWRCLLLLAAFVSLLSLVFRDGRAAPFIPPDRPQLQALDLLREVGIECGTFDGQYTCRHVPGGRQFGKNAGPNPATGKSAPDSATPEPYTAPPASGTWSTEATQGEPPADAAACKYGMVGTPPNCRCPPNSELLGGNCVRYTASACSNGLAADAMPQACRGVEEKVSCTTRQDGLKDCCCVTYDKF
jgi:hypothetical protein